MKSTHKLVFKNKEDIMPVAMNLIKVLNRSKFWREDCDFFVRKNILYVDTANYTCVNNALENLQYRHKYCFDIIKTKNCL